MYNKIYGINKLPLIEDIDVKYTDRNSVLLHVYEKKVSGCIKYMGQYVYFDNTIGRNAAVTVSVGEKISVAQQLIQYDSTSA